MAREINPTARYLLLGAVIVAAVAAYQLAERQPRNASMMSPKDYIELVEQKKRERLEAEQAKQQPGEGTAEAR